MNENEKLLRDLARGYAEEYGRQLKSEDQQLKDQGVSYPADGLEKRVKKGLRGKKNYGLRIASLAAAALLVALVGVWMLQPFGSLDPNLASEDPGQSYEIIPISFHVPENFTQTGFEQDYAKSVYYFDDLMRDDVVLIMRRGKEIPETDRMTSLSINGSEAYTIRQEGYNYLTFLKDGVVYELSCRYDINTLISFGAEIL